MKKDVNDATVTDILSDVDKENSDCVYDDGEIDKLIADILGEKKPDKGKKVPEIIPEPESIEDKPKKALPKTEHTSGKIDFILSTIPDENVVCYSQKGPEILRNLPDNENCIQPEDTESFANEKEEPIADKEEPEIPEAVPEADMSVLKAAINSETKILEEASTAEIVRSEKVKYNTAEYKRTIKPEKAKTVNSDYFDEIRQEKIRKFRLVGEEEENELEEAEKKQEEIDDYNAVEDIPSIRFELSKLKLNIAVRLILSISLLLVLTYAELAQTFTLPIPVIFSRSAAPLFYSVFELTVLIILTFVNISAFASGLVSLFTFKEDGDNYLALTLIGCITEEIAIIICPESMGTGSAIPFALSGALMIVFNLIGKMYGVKRVVRNFRFVSSTCDKKFTELLTDRDLSREISTDLASVEPYIAVNRGTKFIKSFLANSYQSDIVERKAKFIAPVLFVAAIFAGISAYVVLKSWIYVITAFSSVLVLASPLSALICSNFQMWRGIKYVNKIGGMISGYEACDEIYDTNCVCADAVSVFPKGTVRLSGIKTFAAGRIDEAILDAASIVIKANSCLSDVFISSIGNRVDLLREVDTLSYEEGMGLSAWVNSKRVLVGNALLMRHHGIPTPSKDYEDRFLGQGLDIVYLSNSGELCAAFLIDYTASPHVKKAMHRLEDTGLALCVSTRDPNITPKKIAKVYSVSEDIIKIIPNNSSESLEKATEFTEETISGIANIGTFSSFIRTVTTAIKLREGINLAHTLMQIGMIIAFILVMFCVLFNAFSSLSVLTVTVFQLFWLICVTLVPSFKKFR